MKGCQHALSASGRCIDLVGMSTEAFGNTRRLVPQHVCSVTYHLVLISVKLLGSCQECEWDAAENLFALES